MAGLETLAAIIAGPLAAAAGDDAAAGERFDAPGRRQPLAAVAGTGERFAKYFTILGHSRV